MNSTLLKRPKKGLLSPEFNRWIEEIRALDPVQFDGTTRKSTRTVAKAALFKRYALLVSLSQT